MKAYYTIILLFYLGTACARQNTDTTASGNAHRQTEKKISISPADFKGGYPAVLFNVREGTITAVRTQSEPELLAAIADRSLYFFIEPQDPEFNSLDEDSKEVSITCIGHGDNAYLDFEKQGKTISSSKEIGRKDFMKGNVFYLLTGKAGYVLQILQFNKAEQTLSFRYREIIN